MNYQNIDDNSRLIHRNQNEDLTDDDSYRCKDAQKNLDSILSDAGDDDDEVEDEKKVENIMVEKNHGN